MATTQYVFTLEGGAPGDEVGVAVKVKIEPLNWPAGLSEEQLAQDIGTLLSGYESAPILHSSREFTGIEPYEIFD